MKVLFVVPNYPNRIKEYLVLPSLELCIMSATLKEEGHTVELLDMRINEFECKDYEITLKKFNPNIICIDDIPEVHCNTKKIIATIRSIFPKSAICLRGEIPSFIPEKIMQRNPDLDFILRYESDYTLNKIIKCIELNENFKNIPNIAYRENDKIIITDIETPNKVLDNLPIPDRKLYDIEKYLQRDSETIVRSSRGCPGNCLFCIKTKFEKFNIFSISRFCDEIEELIDYGFESFFFSDDTFAFSIKRLIEFERELIKRNLKIKWTSNIRIVDIDEEKIKLMKKLGAYRVFVGIETINEKASKTINKKLNTSIIEEKINILKKYDMQFHASFILGNPGDNEETLEETMKFVKKISPTLVTFNLIKIYPGLDIYNEPEKYDMILPDPFWFENDEWSKKVIMGTKALPPELLEKWSRIMLMEFIK